MRDLSLLYMNIPNSNFRGLLNLSKFWNMSKYISENIVGKNKSVSDVRKTILLLLYYL